MNQPITDTDIQSARTGILPVIMNLLLAVIIIVGLFLIFRAIANILNKNYEHAGNIDTTTTTTLTTGGNQTAGDLVINNVTQQSNSTVNSSNSSSTQNLDLSVDSTSTINAGSSIISTNVSTAGSANGSITSSILTSTPDSGNSTVSISIPANGSSPVVNSNVPIVNLSTVPSTAPFSVPSTAPSSVPSTAPFSVPSTAPSSVPSTIPASVPSTAPSSVPSTAPSSVPSTMPSTAPSSVPSTVPVGVELPISRETRTVYSKYDEILLPSSVSGMPDGYIGRDYICYRGRAEDRNFMAKRGGCMACQINKNNSKDNITKTNIFTTCVYGTDEDHAKDPTVNTKQMCLNKCKDLEDN